jgi:hypothetical protein
MNNIADAYQHSLRKISFERSDLFRDPNSSYWAGLFQPLARSLCERMGREAYDAWYDAQFPGEEVGKLYTWKAKHQAIELALKAQVQA